MEIVQNILVAIHLLGMAAIVGTFLVQMRATSGFAVGLVLGGAITQLVTGLLIVGLAEMGDEDLNYAKIGVKLTIAVVVLVAAIVAFLTARRDGKVRPAFHAAGGLALVNVLVATLWH